MIKLILQATLWTILISLGLAAIVALTVVTKGGALFFIIVWIFVFLYLRERDPFLQGIKDLNLKREENAKSKEEKDAS